MAAGQKFSTCTFVAFIPGTLAVVLTIIATSTHYWVESFSERRTGVNSMGLWQICFGDDFAAPWHVQDVLGKRYADCNWVLDYELRTLRPWLFQGWFIAVCALMTLALMTQLLALVFQLVYLMQGCFLRSQHYALLCAGLSNFVAGIMIAVSTLIYGWFAGYDEYWLPYPHFNYLSWSYGVAVVAGVFSFVAGFFEIVDFLRLNVVSRLEKRAATYDPSYAPSTFSARR